MSSNGSKLGIKRQEDNDTNRDFQYNSMTNDATVASTPSLQLMPDQQDQLQLMPISSTGSQKLQRDVDLDKMRKEARKSKMVKKMEKKAGVNNKTFGELVSSGPGGTGTTMGKNPTININENSTEEGAVEGYAHELSNMVNAKKTYKINKDARSGKITSADEYADKIMEIETEAVLNSGIASLELGYSLDHGAEANEIIEQLFNKKLSYKKAFDKMYELQSTAVITSGSDAGRNARDYYKSIFNAMPKRPK